MDISQMRNEFTMHGLSRKELDENPFEQFEKWFNEATASGLAEPNAFSLATVAENGQPSMRTVPFVILEETINWSRHPQSPL